MTPNEKHVVAVAGGGKTTYLVARLREAIKESGPDKIIAVTYTRNMAKELKQKIGVPLKYCGTLHHILYQLLTEENPNKYLSIVAEMENADIITDIGAKIRLKATPSLLSKVLTSEDYKLTYLEKMFRKQYMKYFDANRMISYPLIEHYGARLIGKSEWDWMFVDEYQDMSLENIAMLKRIQAKNKLFVYDPMQSIYSFRGARPELLPKSDEILGKSYRCPSEIVNFTNYLLTYARDDYPVMMEPANQGGELTIVNEKERHCELRAQVERLLEKYSPGEIAILARTNRLLEEAQQHLEGIPYQKVSSQVLSSHEMLAFKYLLRIMLIQDDYNVIRFAKAAKLIGKEQAALSDYIDPITGVPTIKGLSAAKSVREMPLFKNILEAMRIHPIPVAAKIMMETMNGREWIIEEAVTILNWLSLYYGKDYDKLENALSELDTDALIGSDDRIKLMTVHTAKGLEFKAIIIVNLYNGAFPHYNADAKEELRLFYVAVTRAKETCVLLRTGKHTWLDNYTQTTILED